MSKLENTKRIATLVVGWSTAWTAEDHIANKIDELYEFFKGDKDEAKLNLTII